MQFLLQQADCLVIRPPAAPASRRAPVAILRLDDVAVSEASSGRPSIFAQKADLGRGIVQLALDHVAI